MALLELRDIGKIYVSDGGVAVGIRGVNLSFERGEFVAVTGKSGSGKSTLLNVISGMDSYEEGELLVEGQPTAHYLQPEWEEYREKYISFIFQDYNIIESFTVLQNVELALMHIEDKKARRARAMELIRRVGLESHARHKGSKLSGGQKQRTVIARALAKDSPIILADEPTGNLDFATSQQIIALLGEVARDKLLIVVTHNYEQVAEHATRHVRIFDGAVESDHVLRDTASMPEAAPAEKAAPADKKQKTKQMIGNGFTLGHTIFTSKPRLSAFLCFLMIVGTLGIFLVTSLFGDMQTLFAPNYMFRHIDGRLVLTKQNGSVFTEEELSSLKSEHGANSYLHYDALLDEGAYNTITLPTGEDEWDHEYVSADYVYGKSYGDDILGRYPQERGEVLLYLPISYQTDVGRNSILLSEVLIGRVQYKLVGVKYYYDNNRMPECLFTEDGFRTATASYLLTNNSTFNAEIAVYAKDGTLVKCFSLYDMVTSFELPSDKLYIDLDEYHDLTKGTDYVTEVTLKTHYFSYDSYFDTGISAGTVFTNSFTDESITDTRPSYDAYETGNAQALVIGAELLCQTAESVLEKTYKQASLFFGDDEAAHIAAKRLRDTGFIAVPSDTTYEPNAAEVILSVISCVVMGLGWILSILFLSFFIRLCSSRTLEAFKGDMAIMRSMGIPSGVIRIGTYVRMLIALIPAFILVILTAILIFTTPKFSAFFVYLYPWQYALIFIGMIAITLRATHNHIRHLFDESVKKSLKGGRAE